MNIEILRAGFMTTVQDLGRTGFRRSGVSVGGALDQQALTVANFLVGNEAASAGLELNLGRASLRFLNDRVIAWCGGAADVRVGAIAVPAGHASLVRAGEELALSAAKHAARVWLAISGGIDVPSLLGSRSTDLRSRFGGFEGRSLHDGDLLALGRQNGESTRIARRLLSARISDWFAPSEWTDATRPSGLLRIVRGADWSRFAEDSLGALVSRAYTVLPESDRMGLRLAGAELARRTSVDLLSETVTPGTIQVPASGQPILLLGDCQTIGGYPKIAHVITVDLSAAAQLWPGDHVRFSEVSLAEAQAWLIERERETARFRTGLALHTA